MNAKQRRAQRKLLLTKIKVCIGEMTSPEIAQALVDSAKECSAYEKEVEKLKAHTQSLELLLYRVQVSMLEQNQTLLFWTDDPSDKDLINRIMKQSYKYSE